MMHTTAKLIRVVVITVIIVVAGMLLLWRVTDNKPLPPDRAPANIEENAVIGSNDNNQQNSPTNGVVLNYKKDVSIDLAAKTAALHFENPAQSLYDAAIFLVIQDNIILQSGLLPPGSVLTTLSLPEEGIPLQTGGYDAAILVQFYDESGNTLSVNAKIDGVNVDVK